MATTTKIYFRGSHEQAKRLALMLGTLLNKNNHPVGRAFMSSVGFGALSDIKQAYIVKAKGGTDEMGIKWPPLHPKTVANRRVGKKDLADPDIKARETIRKREEKKLLKRYLLSMPVSEATKKARQVASLRATIQTGKTKVQTLGGRQVEILRDTGVLFNSLSPGVLIPGGEYRSSEDDQIFELNAGKIIVGTNVLYAATHNYGDASRGIPRRQFLPDNDGQVPEVWWDRWFAIAQVSLGVAFKMLLEGEQNG